MAEIDTKSVEPVQATLYLLGGENEQRRNQSASKNLSFELNKEKEVENLVKDLADVKVQLEEKDSAYKQGLLKLDHYQKTADDLSTLLKHPEIAKDTLINDCNESRIRISELESTIKNMDNQLSESESIRKQLSHVLAELKDTQEKNLMLETELAAAKDAKFEAMAQVEVVETDLSLEKLKTDELLRHVRELNETIIQLKMAASEAEKEKNSEISVKAGEIQLAEAAVSEGQKEQLELMHYSENQLLDKSALIESMKQEIHKENALSSSSEKIGFDALCELNQTKTDLELKKEKNLDQAGDINILEAEFYELKMELSKANQEMQRMIGNAEEMREELEKARSEMTEAREKETAARIEIVVLKSELHKGRSIIAAVEAAEDGEKCDKSAFYDAIEQLAEEAEESNENRLLKEGSQSCFHEEIQHEDCIKSMETPNIKSEAGEGVGKNKKMEVQVTIPEEYEILVKKAEQGDKFLKPGEENSHESGDLKKDLEIAISKIAEFRTRAEQAANRAEIAEKTKAELEEKIKKWKEHKARRKAALAALQEVSVSKEILEASNSEDINILRCNTTSKVNQPLGKVLNMKF